MTTQSDVVVIGGGIAGVSAAAALAATHQVTLLERESALAFHTTGRSAATFHSNVGTTDIRQLTAASRHHLFNPNEWLDAELVTKRGILTVARADQLTSLARLRAAAAGDGTPAERLTPSEAHQLHPLVRLDYAAAALWEPESWDIDVAALHQGFVRQARAGGASIETDAGVTVIERRASGWRLDTALETFQAAIVVNAAGAWGDEVAAMAGVPPIGLRPLRRTAFMVPGDAMYADLPFIFDADEDFYLRPDGPQFLCSPAEEEPASPGDPHPRDVDVALAIKRINAATTLGIRSVRSQWTGLRTFSPDRGIVIGFEPDHEGFFWLVGQGGTGIQSSPGAGSLAATLIRGDNVSGNLAQAGVDPARSSPVRYR